jgi:uncharacterized membrane protein YphA (DoxX/SURF4 family)
MNNLLSEKFVVYAPAVVRVGMSLVLLWFGYSQLVDTPIWVAWLPAWTSALPVAAETLIRINGIFEVVFGLALLVGFYTRVVALLLALHMVNIVITVGYNATGVRDFGLAVAMIGVFLYGPDRFTLDSFLAARR